MMKKAHKIIIASVIIACHVIIGVLSIMLIGKSENQTDSSSNGDASIPSAAISSDITKDKVFLLDKEYEIGESDTASTAEICSLNNNFKAKWQTKLNLYYQTLLDYYGSNAATERYYPGKSLSPAEMKAVTEQAQTDWEEYSQKAIQSYNEHLKFTYTSGTMVPILISRYAMETTRDRAIELYYQCKELGIEVTTP